MSDEIIIPDPPEAHPPLGRGKGTETITVVRKPRPDKLKPVDAAEERFDIEKCVVWPRGSFEEGRGWIQISGFSVFAPPNADILAEDQVVCRGELHSVIGTPGDFWNKRGKKKGLLVTLERVS
jgi:hypothetical protein